MLQKLKKHIDSRFPYLLNHRLLLAVSGGIDSIVMLHLFSDLKMDIAVAHCNFQLRGEDSYQDFEFVKQTCLQLGIPFFSTVFDTEKYAEEKSVSIQIAARELRYNWFDKVLLENNYDHLITAHHLDDVVETFLINFGRGTGLEGLTGIPEENGNIVRPMLIFSREEIQEYASVNNIQWREDYTNAQTKYLRNKIRKDIVPIFKQNNQGFLSSFQNTISYLRQANSMVEDASEEHYKNTVTKKGDTIYISISELKKRNNYNSYLHYWLQPYGFKAWVDIEALVEGDTGKMIFSDKYVLLKNREYLILDVKSKLSNNDTIYHLNESETIVEPIAIKSELCSEFCQSRDLFEVYFDKDKLKFPLILRKWKQGDYFYPLGMSGKKKVSKYFKDEKFSQIDKENVWILCSDEQIVWIIGSRMDDRFKVKDTTKQVLKIKVIK